MDDAETFNTPEDAAAAAVSGETVDVDARNDGRWAVVVRRSRGALWFVVCKREDGGWVIEDDGEMAAFEDSVRSTWISVMDFDEHGPNVGVEITWGNAPTDVVRGVLRSGDVELAVPVDSGSYWLVRWEVPDPAESDDGDWDLIQFVSA